MCSWSRRSWLPILLMPSPREVTVKVSFGQRLGPIEIDRMALGQGGLSDEPMWDSRVAEVRALRPRVIRLFIQEYFQLLPATGRDHFETLDRSVDTILKAGAKPLMCICFKPGVLFPTVDQDRVEPDDYAEWERLISSLVCTIATGGGDQILGGRQRAGHRRVGGLPVPVQARELRPLLPAHGRGHPPRRSRGPRGRTGAGEREVADPPRAPGRLRRRQDPPALHLLAHLQQRPGRVRGTIAYAKDLLKQHPRSSPRRSLTSGTWTCRIRRSTRGSSRATSSRPCGR